MTGSKGLRRVPTRIQSNASLSMKDRPVWGKHIVKERDEISAEERIRTQHRQFLERIVYKINENVLGLPILENRIFKAEGRKMYKIIDERKKHYFKVKEQKKTRDEY